MFLFIRRMTPFKIQQISERVLNDLHWNVRREVQGRIRHPPKYLKLLRYGLKYQETRALAERNPRKGKILKQMSL